MIIITQFLKVITDKFGRIYFAGLESSVSSSPLSSIVSSNAAISSNFETDIDLDQLLYDTLRNGEDSTFRDQKLIGRPQSGLHNGPYNNTRQEKDTQTDLSRSKYLEDLLSGVNVDTSQFDSLLSDMTSKKKVECAPNGRRYEGASYDVNTRTVAAIRAPDRTESRSPKPEGHW